MLKNVLIDKNLSKYVFWVEKLSADAERVNFRD